MITTDYHLHTSFSGDSNEKMEDMIRACVKKGLMHICFTDHCDMDFPDDGLVPKGKFEVDTDAYYKQYMNVAGDLVKDMFVGFGVELGLQACCLDKCAKYAKEYPFDFIIGSSHLCNGKDPYFPYFYEGRSEKEAYTEYFESILYNVNHYEDFDVYGHLDYVVRYGPNKDKYYSYEEYGDILDEIMKKLIEKGKGIEINTGGFRSGLNHPNPTEDVVKRYFELGGEILTVGSDAHKAEDVAFNFDKAKMLLESLGVKYITVFKSRKPEFIRL